MRKTLALLFVAALLAGISGCAGSTGNGTQQNTGVTPPQGKQSVAPEPAQNMPAADANARQPEAAPLPAKTLDTNSAQDTNVDLGDDFNTSMNELDAVRRLK